MKINTKPSALLCLSLAAIALPGVSPDAQAGRVEETYNADFQYAHYEESSERMSIDTFDLAGSTPIGRAMTGSLSLVRDTMGGASPINNKLSNGKVTQVLSGASKNALRSDCGESICDQRDGITGGLTYFFDAASLAFGGGFSQERDYTSRYFNTNLSVDFNKKLTTLNLGASVAFDKIQPTELAGGFMRNRDCGLECSKTTQQYLIGVSQIIDKDSLVQNNMTFAYNTGYLSDPYKKVYFYDDNGFFYNVTNDTRPDEKFQWTWLTQYVRHFGELNHAALHVDYRFSTDDWDVNTFTTEISWHQPIAAGWLVVPRFRYYSQDQASFYRPVGSKNDFLTTKVYSSDYRLAGFGTLSGGLKFVKTITGIKHLQESKIQIGAEYYDHSAGYELGGNSLGNFADFSYYLLTASFNLKF